MADYISRANAWLTGDFDPETKGKIIELRNSDHAAFEDAFYKNLEFGTGGLRGIMGVGTNRMNKYTVGMATQGLANYILAHCKEDDLRFCISYDSRNNSKEFARITADVMSANGIHVYIFDNIRPTPELSDAIRLKGAVAGVMITASHNPKEYNGYKVFWSDGGQITSPVDKDIVAEVNKITEPSMVKFSAGERCGSIDIMGADVDELYLRDILSLAMSPEACRRHSDIKFVYTPLHGCGVRLVPECLKRLGFKHVIHVPDQDVSDGNFPTVVSPNPEEPAAMKMALEAADREGADIVMATDPDADRLGIAVRDNDGKMVQFNGNMTATLLTYYILSRRKELGTLGEGKYLVKKDHCFIGYKEYDPDNPHKVYNNVIRVDENMVTISRNGPQRSRLMLERNRRHQCIYETVAGSLSIGVFTKTLESNLGKKGGTLKVSYTLDFNSDLVSENKFTVKVEEKHFEEQ